MTITVILAAALVLATTFLHYAALRFVSAVVPQLRMAREARVLCVVLLTFLAHVTEVIIYAAAYWLSVERLGLGRFGGLAIEDPLDYLYFSVVSYTSLGLGDVFPHDHLRFLTGIEALNGLLLIGWSASYTYLAMGRLWPWAPYRAPTGRAD